MEELKEKLKEVAENLAMQIVHSEQGHYQPVYERVLENLSLFVTKAFNDGKKEERETIIGVLNENWPGNVNEKGLRNYLNEFHPLAKNIEESHE
jgi:hypothetical protein